MLILRRKASKETQIRLNYIMAVLTLLYGLEFWVPRQKHLGALQTGEMKFLREVQGCSRLVRVRSDYILATLDVEELMTSPHR